MFYIFPFLPFFLFLFFFSPPTPCPPFSASFAAYEAAAGPKFEARIAERADVSYGRLPSIGKYTTGPGPRIRGGVAWEISRPLNVSRCGSTPRLDDDGGRRRPKLNSTLFNAHPSSPRPDNLLTARSSRSETAALPDRVYANTLFPRRDNCSSLNISTVEAPDTRDTYRFPRRGENPLHESFSILSRSRSRTVVDSQQRPDNSERNFLGFLSREDRRSRMWKNGIVEHERKYIERLFKR